VSDWEAILSALVVCAVFAAAIFAVYFVYSEFNPTRTIWAVVFALGFAIFTLTTFTYGVGVGVLTLIGCLLAAALGGAPFLLYAIWKDRRAN
jgi:hypothetical protein